MLNLIKLNMQFFRIRYLLLLALMLSFIITNAQVYKILFGDTAYMVDREIFGGFFNLKDTLPDGEWLVYQKKEKLGVGYKSIYYANPKYWGKLSLKGTYKNSVKNGEFIYYSTIHDRDFVLRIENYRNGVLDGKYREWHSPNIKELEGDYKNGLKNSNWERWNKHGNKVYVEHYKNDTLGEWITYYENGNKKEKGKGGINYTEGKLTHWYNNGNKSYEGEFKLGRIQNWKKWHENGGLKQEAIGEFSKGYFEQLPPHYSCPLCDRKPNSGTVKYYDEQGKFIKEEIYNKGKLIEIK